MAAFTAGTVAWNSSAISPAVILSLIHIFKTLALLALESFEQFRVSVGEQVFDFIIREGAVCFQAEHGQTALVKIPPAKVEFETISVAALINNSFFIYYLIFCLRAQR